MLSLMELMLPTLCTKTSEISMTSGTFQVGETVEGVMLRTGLSEDLSDDLQKLHLELPIKP